jgi:hypothetical protein
MKLVHRAFRARLCHETNLVAARTQAARQPVDDALGAAVQLRRHFDLGIGGEHDAHQRSASM